MIHPDRLKMMARQDHQAVPLSREGGEAAPMQQPAMFPDPKAQTGYGFPGAMQHFPPAGAPYGYGMPGPYGGVQPVPYVDPNVMAQPQYPPPVLQQPPHNYHNNNTNPSWAGAQTNQPGGAADQSAAPTEVKPPKIVGDWQQFETPEGKPYYFNSKTQETTWNAPPEFANAAAAPRQDSEWQTFYTPEGKPYYYNPRLNQTVWEKPVEAKKPEPEAAPESEPKTEEENVQEAPADSKNAESENVVVDPLLVKPYQPWATKEYATREEAVDAFHALLSSSGVPSTASWEQALPKIVHDKRYRALTKLNERKEAFKEWCVKHAEFERAEAKRLASERRSNFEAMLSEFKDRLHSRVRYVEIEPLIRLDPRYLAMEARDREDVFYSFVDNMIEEERKAKIAQRKEREEAFRNFLTSSGKITTKTQWRNLLDSIRDEEAYKSLDPADALKVFEQVLGEMKREEDKRVLAEREAARDAERQRRADFRSLLLEQMNGGKLHLRTRWRTFCEIIRDDPRFVALSHDSKHNGQTLFDDFCDELEDRVLVSRKKLKEAMVACGIELIRDTDTVEGLSKQLEGTAALQGVPDIHVQVLLNEYIDHAQSKAAHAARRLEKYSNLFAKLLSKKIRKAVPWEVAVPLLESHSAYKKLDEAVRDEMFKNHIESLKENGVLEEDIDDTDGEIEEEPPKKMRSPSFDSRRKRSRSPRRRRSRSPQKSPGRRKRSRSISSGRRRPRIRSPRRRRR